MILSIDVFTTENLLAFTFAESDEGYLNRRHSYRLIEAALVVDNLLSKCDQIGHSFPPLIPANEI
ncbi:MAG: hypothetical protein MUD14_05905 [Hydrococcus sp. Prado102]|nr:hypothetical protein [Hydrococcus sp. Prado102]